MISTYKSEKQLKIWVLKPANFPRVESFSNSFILTSAIKDLQNQANTWINKKKFSPKVRLEVLGEQDDPATVHARHIKTILDAVSDLKGVLQENNLSKVFDERIAELDQTEAELITFYEQIHRIELFIGKLLEKEVGARSLMIDPQHEKAGLETLWFQWHDIIKMNLDENLKSHPAEDWVEKFFKKSNALRADVQAKVTYVKLTHQFDQRFGLDIESVRNYTRELQGDSSVITLEALKAYLEYANDVFFPLGTWINWADSQISDLEKLDSENHTNWRDLIEYGTCRGDREVKEYVSTEKERISKLNHIIENTQNLFPPTIDSRYKVMLCEANYLDAYHYVRAWIGFPIELNEDLDDARDRKNALRREINDLARIFKQLDDVEDINKYVNSIEIENITANTPSILIWCGKMIEQIQQATPSGANPSESHSNVYQSLFQKLQPVQARLVKSTQVVHKTLVDLSTKINLYQTAMDIIEEKNRRFIDETQRSFLWFRKKRIQRIIHQRNQAVCEAYQIAPNSKDIKEAIDRFGINVSDQSPRQYFDPNSELGQTL